MFFSFPYEWCDFWISAQRRDRSWLLRLGGAPKRDEWGVVEFDQTVNRTIYVFHWCANLQRQPLMYCSLFNYIYLDTMIQTDYWALNISTYSAIPSKCSVDICVHLHQLKLRCMTYHYDIDRGHWYTASSSATNLNQTCKSNLGFVSECVCGSTRSGRQQVACHIPGKEIGLSWCGEWQCLQA